MAHPNNVSTVSSARTNRVAPSANTVTSRCCKEGSGNACTDKKELFDNYVKTDIVALDSNSSASAGLPTTATPKDISNTEMTTIPALDFPPAENSLRGTISQDTNSCVNQQCSISNSSIKSRVLPPAFDPAVLKSLRCQLEYYFSWQNLSKDSFLQSIMMQYNGYAPVTVIATFSNVKRIIQSTATSYSVNDWISEAVSHSTRLKLVVLGQRGGLLAISSREWITDFDNGHKQRIGHRLRYHKLKDKARSDSRPDSSQARNKDKRKSLVENVEALGDGPQIDFATAPSTIALPKLDSSGPSLRSSAVPCPHSETNTANSNHQAITCSQAVPSTVSSESSRPIAASTYFKQKQTISPIPSSPLRYVERHTIILRDMPNGTKPQDISKMIFSCWPSDKHHLLKICEIYGDVANCWFAQLDPTVDKELIATAILNIRGQIFNGVPMKPRLKRDMVPARLPRKVASHTKDRRGGRSRSSRSRSKVKECMPARPNEKDAEKKASIQQGTDSSTKEKVGHNKKHILEHVAEVSNPIRKQVTTAGYEVSSRRQEFERHESEKQFQSRKKKDRTRNKKAVLPPLFDSNHYPALGHDGAIVSSSSNLLHWEHSSVITNALDDEEITVPESKSSEMGGQVTALKGEVAASAAQDKGESNEEKKPEGIRSKENEPRHSTQEKSTESKDDMSEQLQNAFSKSSREVPTNATECANKGKAFEDASIVSVSNRQTVSTVRESVDVLSHVSPAEDGLTSDTKSTASLSSSSYQRSPSISSFSFVSKGDGAEACQQRDVNGCTSTCQSCRPGWGGKDSFAAIVKKSTKSR